MSDSYRAHPRDPSTSSTSTLVYQSSSSLPLPDEETPLLHPSLSATCHSISKDTPNGWNAHTLCLAIIQSIPAVFLGCLINSLEGISYGMIIFPAEGVFAERGVASMGVPMFFLSTLIGQLVYTLGGSQFAGANASIMIEVVPFFHIIALRIAREIGPQNPREIVATTLVAFAFSSILTGVSFLILGALRLGVVIAMFPRHILVGCIGGVGVFLVQSGLTVSARMEDLDKLEPALAFMFASGREVALWLIPLVLALLLTAITQKLKHPFIFPSYFVVIPAAFYVVVLAARLDFGMLRKEGWLFDVAAEHEVWYKFYTYLDPSLVRWRPLVMTLPTQIALLFFNILHPPLNVPTLSVSLDQDVDTNKELIAHGWSNLLAGLVGTVPNYLVYVNTLMFYRVGGGSRVAGFILALSTVVLLLVGTGFIAFIPVMVVGALIFVLGIDLVKEALWDSKSRVSRSEYATIVCIMVCMTLWDFVVGVLFGILMSCCFFVLENSRISSIHAIHTGSTLHSTVRRPAAHRTYLREAGKNTTILRLRGFLFFGTIGQVEKTIRSIFSSPTSHPPMRFLILDLTNVIRVDISAAETFVRLLRLLSTHGVVLIWSGIPVGGEVQVALDKVGVLGGSGEEVVWWESFSDALQWTEETHLKAWYKSLKAEAETGAPSRGRRYTDIAISAPLDDHPPWPCFPEAGGSSIAVDMLLDEPYNTLCHALCPHGSLDISGFQPLVILLKRLALPPGHILCSHGGQLEEDMYFIESGTLRMTYAFGLEELIMPGTVIGELCLLAEVERDVTVVIEQGAVLWRLSKKNLRRLEEEEPELARRFSKLVLKAVKVYHDCLLSAIDTRQ